MLLEADGLHLQVISRVYIPTTLVACTSRDGNPTYHLRGMLRVSMYQSACGPWQPSKRQAPLIHGIHDFLQSTVGSPERLGSWSYDRSIDEDDGKDWS
jgi:hypothetical protein